MKPGFHDIVSLEIVFALLRPNFTWEPEIRNYDIVYYKVSDPRQAVEVAEKLRKPGEQVFQCTIVEKNLRGKRHFAAKDFSVVFESYGYCQKQTLSFKKGEELDCVVEDFFGIAPMIENGKVKLEIDLDGDTLWARIPVELIEARDRVE